MDRDGAVRTAALWVVALIATGCGSSTSPDEPDDPPIPPAGAFFTAPPIPIDWIASITTAPVGGDRHARRARCSIAWRGAG